MRDEGPPDTVVECGKVIHECESELVCKLSHSESKIPYFNAGIYLENKKKIGKVDEIFGPINLVMFTIKMDPGIVAKSFQGDDLVYISVDKLLPLSRFTSREFIVCWLRNHNIYIISSLSYVADVLSFCSWWWGWRERKRCWTGRRKRWQR